VRAAIPVASQRKHCGSTTTWIGRALSDHGCYKFSRKDAAIDFAHEVRNRLNAIRLHADLLGRQKTFCSKTRYHLDVIRSEEQKIEEVVAEILRSTVTDESEGNTLPSIREET